uniref:Uncharacterized protein n=1 Tax=Helianthus annuus TaxID=4232 RepID=A0A251UI62_HELAN
MKNKRDQYCQAAKLVCWARIARGTRAFGPPGHVQRQICVNFLLKLAPFIPIFQFSQIWKFLSILGASFEFFSVSRTTY